MKQRKAFLFAVLIAAGLFLMPVRGYFPIVALALVVLYFGWRD